MDRGMTADRTMRLSETTGLLRRIAEAMIARKGEYTFTDSKTGAKVRVIR
jgi:hypothetical protein